MYREKKGLTKKYCTGILLLIYYNFKYRRKILNYEQKEKANALLQKIKPLLVINAINFERRHPFQLCFLKIKLLRLLIEINVGEA